MTTTDDHAYQAGYTAAGVTWWGWLAAGLWIAAGLILWSAAAIPLAMWLGRRLTHLNRHYPPVTGEPPPPCADCGGMQSGAPATPPTNPNPPPRVHR